MKNIANYLDDYMSDDFEFESKSYKFTASTKDIIKANRKFSREEELETYGKPINYNHTFKNKKAYTRKDKHKQNYKN